MSKRNTATTMPDIAMLQETARFSLAPSALFQYSLYGTKRERTAPLKFRNLYLEELDSLLKVYVKKLQFTQVPL